MRFYMSPAAGAERSLSPNPDTCFVRHPVALNAISDPSVSFRVNFFPLHLGVAELFEATRNGNTLTGSLMISGDALPGHWTATFCPTCPDSAKECP